MATTASNPFKLRDGQLSAREGHIHRHGIRCVTDKRGHETPRGRSPFEIVVDASEGFIPLWERQTTLRWRFNEQSMNRFEDPAQAKAEVRKLMGEALLAWGDAAPIKFSEKADAWDFEIVVRNADDCDSNGSCVLASAFFPDAGRHELVIYPQMFGQSRAEQVETMVHEFGHVFGLRHFFAAIKEKAWPSIIFGEHKKFTIMNYGEDSRLTDADRSDLKRLYAAAWSREITHINGTPIRLMKPFHASGAQLQALETEVRHIAAL